MKIAIPVFNERLSPLLDTAYTFVVFSQNNQGSEKLIRANDCSVSRFLQMHGCNAVVYSRMSREVADMLYGAGIFLISSGISGVDDLLNLLSGSCWKADLLSGNRCCRRRGACVIKDGIIRETNMKIALTAMGETSDCEVDQRFGRAKGFMIFDEDGGSWSYLSNNQNYNAPQGAGIQAAGTVLDAGVSVLISGHVGPKAFSVLKAADVSIYTGAEGSVENALQMYRDGKLVLAAEADVEGHW